MLFDDIQFHISSVFECPLNNIRIRQVILILGIPVIFILLADWTDHPAGISGGNAIVRSILCDNAAGANYHITSDGYAGVDHDIAADPYLVTDSHRLCVFQIHIPDGSGYGMSCGVNRNMRCNVDIISNGHGGQYPAP